MPARLGGIVALRWFDGIRVLVLAVHLSGQAAHFLMQNVVFQTELVQTLCHFFVLLFEQLFLQRGITLMMFKCLFKVGHFHMLRLSHDA